MLAKDRRATIFTSLAILLPLFIGLAKWNEIPNDGAVNIDLQLLNFALSYKFIAVVMVPLAILVLHLLWAIPLSKSPNRKSIGKPTHFFYVWDHLFQCLYHCPSISIS